MPLLRYPFLSSQKISPSVARCTSRVRRLGLFLRPRVERTEKLPLFPGPAHFHSEVADPVLDEAVLPSFRASAWLLSWGRVIQRGSVQSYVLYIFLMLMALLFWR